MVYPTDDYVETEKEYSMQSEIDKITEWKRFNADNKIESLQQGWLPQWLDNVRWTMYDTYFFGDSYKVSRNPYETCISISGITNTLFRNERTQRDYFDSMWNLNWTGTISPFLLFLENTFIPWDRIDVVRKDTHMYLLIKDRDKEIPIKKLDILFFPFKIDYNDDGYRHGDGTDILSFDKDGKFSLTNPKYIINTKDSYVRGFTTYGKFSMRDLSLNDNRNYTKTNTLVFDQDGLLYRDYNVKTDEGALLTIDFNTPMHVSFLYDKRSNDNESPVHRANNRPFVRDILRGREPGDSELKGYLNTHFDFSHDKNISYETNLANSQDYVFFTDQNKYDKIFEDRKNINIVQYDVNNIKQRMVKDGSRTLTMLRDVYDDKQYETYAIIFINGFANSECNNSIKYKPDRFSFTIPLGVILKSFTIIYFKKVRNELIPIKDYGTKENMNVNDFYIPKEDIVLYSDWLGYDSDGNLINLYPLNKEIDKNGYLVLHNEYKTNNKYYMYGKWYIGSRNQFIHKKYVIDDNIIHLGEEFKTAYDERKFWIFYEGKFVNSSSYRVLIPKYSNSNITERAIYFRFEPGIKRTIDVYYLPSDCVANRVETSGDLKIYCIPVYATTDNQLRFKVPYPYKNYPHIYDAFYCIKENHYVDKSLYTFDGDYIVFDPSIKFKAFEPLTFVFPVYKKYWDYDTSNVGNLDQMKFISYYNRTEEFGQTHIEFEYDWRGKPNKDRAHYLFMNTTFIEPSRYTLNDDGSIDMILNEGEYIDEGVLFCFVFETDKDTLNNSNIIMSTYILSTDDDVDEDYEYDLPEPDYWDSFFITRGSVLVSPHRYEVTPDHKRIKFLNSFDGQPNLNWDKVFPQKSPNGRHLYIVFMKHKDDIAGTKSNGKAHICTSYQFYRPSEDIQDLKIDNEFYNHFQFNDTNMILFVNGTYWPAGLRWTMAEGQTIHLLNDQDYIYKNSNVTVLFAYQVLSYDPPDTNLIQPTPREIVYTTDAYSDISNITEKVDTGKTKEETDDEGNIITVPIMEDVTTITATIPWIHPPFTDTAFMVSYDKLFIPENEYTIDPTKTFITIDNKYKDIIKDGSKLRFSFMHNKSFTEIVKEETSVKTEASKKIYDIPSPFNKLVDLNNRFFITYGNEYIDKKNYIIDNINNRLEFINFTLDDPTKTLNFYFYYTATSDNGAIGWLPESGYISIYRENIDRNWNKNMYVIFINGELIQKNCIMDIANSLKKIKVDVKTRYDIVMIGFSPLIKELKNLYTQTLDDGNMRRDTWTKIVDKFEI